MPQHRPDSERAHANRHIACDGHLPRVYIRDCDLTLVITLGDAVKNASASVGSGLLCRIGEEAKSNRDAVPSVDDVNRNGKPNLLLLGKMRSQGFIRARTLPTLGKAGQGVGPRERSAFAIGIARSFVPCRQQVDALLGFSFFSSLDGMQVETASSSAGSTGSCSTTLHPGYSLFLTSHSPRSSSLPGW
jgi:hypothetical protein